MTRFRVLFIVSVLLLSSQAMAGTGIIGGTVKNEWGDGLLGAYAQIPGQPLFVMVGQMNGSYELRKLPAGVCDVLFSQPAYDSLLVRNVVVTADSTTILHVILNLSGQAGATIDTVVLDLPVDSLEVKTDSLGAGIDSK